MKKITFGAERVATVGEYRRLMKRFKHVDAGRKFTRAELNAR